MRLASTPPGSAEGTRVHAPTTYFERTCGVSRASELLPACRRVTGRDHRWVSDPDLNGNDGAEQRKLEVAIALCSCSAMLASSTNQQARGRVPLQDSRLVVCSPRPVTFSDFAPGLNPRSRPAKKLLWMRLR